MYWQPLLALLPFNPRGGSPVILRAYRYNDTQEDRRCGSKPEKNGGAEGKRKGEKQKERKLKHVEATNQKGRGDTETDSMGK